MSGTLQDPRIQWFPGHMTKTKRLIEKNVKLVDVVVEITDARIPQSSRNPEIRKWIGKKPVIVVLNKCDNSDMNITKRWCDYYKSQGLQALATDCKTGKGVKEFIPLVKKTLEDLIKSREQKGMQGQPIRMMVVGIPNVGKSSFINRMAGSRRAKVEDRPGVTRGLQWVTLATGVELMDVPGVLWPKFEDLDVAKKLAFTGAIKDDVVDIELLAMHFLEMMRDLYPQMIIDRYKIDSVEGCDGYELLEKIGRKRGMLISGGEINTERAAIMLLDEYRSGKLGKLSFEAPPKN